MPKAVLTPPLPPAPPPPARAGARVIYELHVRGFTAHPSRRSREAIRGTFAGLAHPAAIAHLRRLGVTHVELMPAAAWADERHLPPLGLTNYWGYNPVALLAPDPRLAPGGMAEVRAAVAALRRGRHRRDPRRRAEPYRRGRRATARRSRCAAWATPPATGTCPAMPRRYVNDAGCGNTLALDRPWPLRLAMDALRHWVAQAGLDGFRLDLATTLGRRATGFDPDAPLLQAMRQDPVLRDRWIIAEPWDIGPAAIGSAPSRPAGANGTTASATTSAASGAAMRGSLGALATRWPARADIFGARPADRQHQLRHRA